MEQLFFSGYHNDPDVVKKSSSGGAFTALTDAWFDEHGDKAVVYGCVLDNDLKAMHCRSVTREDRDRMRGSKYISSDMTGVYRQISEDIKNGRYVLFSGTPCQVVAVKLFLKNAGVGCENNLLTLDFICHGVANKKFFHEYIQHLEKKYRSKAVYCSFRAKTRPGKLQAMEVRFENGKRYVSPTTKHDWFYSAYLKSYIVRSSCFKCRFAKTERASDVTVADNWFGVNVLKGYGESLLIINTEKGEMLSKKCRVETSFSQKEDRDEVYSEQMSMVTNKPDDYEIFHQIYKNHGFFEVQRYIGNNTVKGRIRFFIARIVDRLNLVNTIKTLKKKMKIRT